MSERFKSQDYFRYKRLGKRWRRPVGLQSKLRIRKGGSGMKVSVGYGTSANDRNKIAGARVVRISSERELTSVDNASAILIASSVGAKSVVKIADKAREMNIRILNMKKVKRAKKMLREIEKRKKEQKKDKKKEKETQPVAEKKEGDKR